MFGWKTTPFFFFFSLIIVNFPEYQNVDYLEMIEKCLMIVCFDDPLPESFNLQTPRTETNEINKGYKCGNRDETNMMHQMLGGGGSLYNSGNRWFDKTLQVNIIIIIIKKS